MAHSRCAVHDELTKATRKPRKLAASGKASGDRQARFRAHLATLTTPELLAVADAVTREASRRVQRVNRWAVAQQPARGMA